MHPREIATLNAFGELVGARLEAGAGASLFALRALAIGHHKIVGRGTTTIESRRQDCRSKGDEEGLPHDSLSKFLIKAWRAELGWQTVAGLTEELANLSSSTAMNSALEMNARQILQSTVYIDMQTTMRDGKDGEEQSAN